MAELGSAGILHLLITLFFGWLVICLIVRLILSWLPISPGHPIPRFFNVMTDPVLDPVRRRIPAMGVGFFDISATVAYLFTWWALTLIGTLLTQALPPGW